MDMFESIEQWEELRAELMRQGRRIWQMHYDIHSPEEFHAQFWKAVKRDIEAITHIYDVYKGIMKFPIE